MGFQRPPAFGGSRAKPWPYFGNKRRRMMADIEKRAITQEDIWLMRRVGAPVASPDGNWLATSVIEPDFDPAKEIADLWLVAADGHAAPRRLTSGPGMKVAPAW